MFTNVWYGGSSVAIVIFLIRRRLCMLIQLFFFGTGEKGVAYTLLTSTDQNFSGDLVRNLVSFCYIHYLFRGTRLR